MWTIRYGAAWIHGYCDKDSCTVQWDDHTRLNVQSLHAAKCRITRKSSLTR